MYTITIFGEHVFTHESKEAWVEKYDELLKSSWHSHLKTGYEPK
jgi:hypothetical protein